MSVTPLQSRTNPAYSALGLKLTPSNSPYHRPSGARSPNRSTRPAYDSGLLLKCIIGTTTLTPPAFDCLPRARCFAYVAGATAVLAKLDDDLQISQRFYRAHPTAIPCHPAITNTGPSTPTANPDLRYRTLTPLRESNVSSAGVGSPLGDWGDSPSSRTWTARERIKTATCVALSPDGNFIALGETGYNPRVLIFSTAADASPDIPVAVVGEHTFGVLCVAWSPDSRYLATLGSNQDGYLHVFSVNPRSGNARLHSSNKCTSFINALTWISKNTLVTAGTRHVKIWRIEEARSVSPSKQRAIIDSNTLKAPQSPSTRSLAGRNCLLGPLIDTTFTCLARISEGQAIACTQGGAVCMVDDRDGNQRLSQVEQVGFVATCVSYDSDNCCAWIGGPDQTLHAIHVTNLRASQTPPHSPTSRRRPSRTSSHCKTASVVAVGTISGHVISVDSDRSIQITKSTDGKESALLGSPASELKAHSDSVLGVKPLVRPNHFEAAYFTWSSEGTVYFWDVDGKAKGSLQIVLEQLVEAGDDGPNELRKLMASSKSEFFVSGDRYGVMKVINSSSLIVDYEVKAHAAEITDIAVHQGGNQVLIATCGRDRTIQLFQKNGERWTHTQTMTDHSGSVCGVLFCNEGKKLLSCSGDRTIVIREVALKDASRDSAIAFLPVRTISLRSAPVSMTTSPDLEDVLIVSTMDRSVSEYDIPTGRNQSTYRATDQDNNDAIVMDGLIVVKQRGRHKTPTNPGFLVAGVSTTDKSIRVYDRTGGLVSREWGHTEGITSLACLSEGDKTTFVSTGTDATIMIWDMIWEAPSRAFCEEPGSMSEASRGGDVSPPREPTAARTPLRRVLSRAEIAEFRRPSEHLDTASPLASPSNATMPPISSARDHSPARSIRKKTSRYSLAPSTPTPTSAPPPTSSATESVPPLPTPLKRNSPHTSPKLAQLSESRSASTSSSHRNRSPSPPRPNNFRRPSLDALRLQGRKREPRSRTKSCGPPPQPSAPSEGVRDISAATDSLCRSLRAYRTKLSLAGPTPGGLKEEARKQVERELELTMKAVSETGETGGVEEKEKEKETVRRSGADRGGDKDVVGEEALKEMLEIYSDKLLGMVRAKVEGVGVVSSTPGTMSSS